MKNKQNSGTIYNKQTSREKVSINYLMPKSLIASEFLRKKCPLLNAKLKKKFK